MADISALTWPEDGDRVLDLCHRARDYVALDTGKGPDMAYAAKTMTDAPPGVPPDQVRCWGATEHNVLSGLATCLKGYHAPDEWYIGLLLLDSAARGRGLGTRMVQQVIAQARADDATCLRIAVLDANPRGRAFWTRLGFAHETTTTAGDGQMRHVHRLPLNEDDT